MARTKAKRLTKDASASGPEDRNGQTVSRQRPSALRRPEIEDRVEGGLVRVVEAARLLAISRSKLYELLNTGRLAYVDLGGFKRIPLSAIKALIDGNRVGGDSEADAQDAETAATA